MKAILIISILFLGFFTASCEEHQENLFQKANDLYASNDFEQAATTYEELVGSGYESKELYFNLGNSFFKLKEYPKAILFLEKSLKLDPSFTDASFNLSIANSMITDKITPLPAFFITKWWRSFTHLFSIDTWAWINIALAFLFIGVLIKYILGKDETDKQFYFFNSLFFFTLTITVYFVTFSAKEALDNGNTAIIFIPTVNVKSSPSVSGQNLFVVHSGSKVKLIEKVNDWQKIALADGNVGWIGENDFVEI